MLKTVLLDIVVETVIKKKKNQDSLINRKIERTPYLKYIFVTLNTPLLSI